MNAKVGAGGTVAIAEEQGQLEQLLDFYGFLIQANGLIARADDIEALYVDICKLGILLDRRLILAWVGMREEGSDTVRVVAHAGPAAGYLEGIRVLAVADDVRGRGPTGRALREGRVVVANRFLDDPSTEPWHDKAREFGIASAVTVPLRRHGQLCGALMLYASMVDVFDERILGELEVLSESLSHAIDAAAERALRRELDARLLASQLEMRTILDAAEQTIMMVTPEGRALMINQMGAQRLGRTPEEVIDQDVFALLPPEVAARRRDWIAEAVAGGRPLTREDERGGHVFRTTLYPLGDGPPRVVIYAEEITDRIAAARAEAEARRREQRQAERWLTLLRLTQRGEYEGGQGEHDFFSQALEEAQRLTSSRVGFVHLVNDDQRTCDLVAWTQSSLHDETLNLSSHYPIGEAGVWADSFRERRGLIVNDPLPGASPLRRLIAVPVIEEDKVRLIAWVGDKAEPYDQDDLEFLQVLATDAWRIVRRRRIEQELREALQVVEASPVVCFRWLAEPGWPIDYVSRNVNRWGWQAADLMAGRPAFVELVHPDDLARVADEVARNTEGRVDEYIQQYRMRTADGRWFWIEDSTRIVRDAAGRPLAYEGVVADIDVDKRHAESLVENLEVQRALNQRLAEAQNQLVQSEKMASIGQLAAGVAHEINNPIGFVNSNLGSLGNYLQDIFAVIDVAESTANASAHPEEFAPLRQAMTERELDYLRGDITQLLAESKDGLERVRKIVQDLKDFSRVGEVQWQWANVHRGLDSTLNIVWNELKYKCEVTKQYGTLPEIYCLPSQLNQVFMNLLVNAAQAIDDWGRITIATEALGAEAVRIRISDTGHGIPAASLPRIFDPFYTTKPVGKGTGLGLSLVWGIVKRHQGSIDVDSTPGQGTTFTVTLPVKPADTGEAPGS